MVKQLPESLVFAVWPLKIRFDGSEIRRSPVDMVNIPLSQVVGIGISSIDSIYTKQPSLQTISKYHWPLSPLFIWRRADTVRPTYCSSSYRTYLYPFLQWVCTSSFVCSIGLSWNITPPNSTKSRGNLPSQSMPRHLCFSNQIKLLTLVHFRQEKGWLFGIPTDFYRRFSSSLPNPAAVHGFGLPEQIDSFERTKDLKGLAVTS